MRSRPTLRRCRSRTYTGCRLPDDALPANEGRMRLRRLLWVPALLAVLAGCTAPRLGSAQAQETPGNPAALPRRTVTNFTEGLRCMDDLMLRFGVHDVSVMLEEMEDKTGKLGGGARDMMVSA